MVKVESDFGAEYLSNAPALEKIFDRSVELTNLAETLFKRDGKDISAEYLLVLNGRGVILIPCRFLILNGTLRYTPEVSRVEISIGKQAFFELTGKKSVTEHNPHLIIQNESGELRGFLERPVRGSTTGQLKLEELPLGRDDKSLRFLTHLFHNLENEPKSITARDVDIEVMIDPLTFAKGTTITRVAEITKELRPKQ